MPEGWRPRGVTPRPRSGTAAESTRLRRRRNGGEEIPRVQVRGGDERSYPPPRTPGWRSGAAAGWSHPTPLRPRPGAAAGRSHPTPLRPRPGAVAGRSNPRLRPGAVAGRTNPRSKEPWLQEGLEELVHIEGQEG